MNRTVCSGLCLAAALCAAAVVFPGTQLTTQVASLDPAKMPPIGTVDEHFQSYNIEMVEVIGGRFWKPYESSATNNSNAQEPARQEGFTPAGLWITETADAACGGNPWASTFLDTFRYIVQHASLAQRGVKVIMHNTLASSDYGLLDENTFAPRPNYWAALLWRRLMGATVLDPHTSPVPNVHVYAHCLQNHPGGVTLLVINADRQQVHEITLPSDAERYTLTAKQLQDTSVELNGKTLQLNRDGDVPQFLSQLTRAGHIRFAPTSITFLAITNADNSNCH